MNKELKITKNTSRNVAIAKDRMLGATYKELSKKYGIKDSSISYALNRDEIKDVMNMALNHLATFAPIVVKNYRDLLESKNENIRLKATTNLAQILGIQPSHTPSQINNLYIQQNNINGISDTMREVIKRISIGYNSENDVIDAEFQELINE